MDYNRDNVVLTDSSSVLMVVSGVDEGLVPKERLVSESSMSIWNVLRVVSKPCYMGT